MIGSIRYSNGRDFACDDCKKVVERFKSVDKARTVGGWCVDRKRNMCYCPSCAPRHRHVGRGGAKNRNSLPSSLPKGFVQTAIKFD